MRKKQRVGRFDCSIIIPPVYKVFRVCLIRLSDWDCVAAVEHLPALHYSVDFIFLSFGIMGFIEELENI